VKLKYLQIIDKKVRNIHIILNSLCESDSLSPEEFAQTNKLLADADRAKQVSLRALAMYYPFIYP